MDAFVIEGSRRLSGRVRVNGSKNAALPLLAAALLTEPAVFGVELVGDLLAVRTSEFGAFSAIIAPTARRAGVRLYEVTPTDDSLESVFSYLVRR